MTNNKNKKGAKNKKRNPSKADHKKINQKSNDKVSNTSAAKGVDVTKQSEESFKKPDQEFLQAPVEFKGLNQDCANYTSPARNESIN